MSNNDPKKCCGGSIVDALGRVAHATEEMNAIEKNLLMRTIIGARLPVDVLAGLAVAVHAGKEMLRVLPRVKF